MTRASSADASRLFEIGLVVDTTKLISYLQMSNPNML